MHQPGNKMVDFCDFTDGWNPNKRAPHNSVVLCYHRQNYIKIPNINELTGGNGSFLSRKNYSLRSFVR